jgi:hypothetical protein
LSSFHQTYGFYVHGVALDAALLPEGWQDRAVPVADEIGTPGKGGWDAAWRRTTSPPASWQADPAATTAASRHPAHRDTAGREKLDCALRR